MKKILSLHPFLFGIYPVLFLYSFNVAQISIGEIFSPLIFMIFFVLVIEILIYFILKNKKKGAIVISFLLFIIFAYGEVHNWISRFSIAGFSLASNKYFAVIWLIVFAVGLFLIFKSKINLEKITKFLTVTAAVLFVFPVINILSYQFSGKNIETADNELEISRVKDKAQLPNIYEIILDGYGSSRSLKKFYGFDNSEFEKDLTKLGFHIVSNARSNYSETRLSFASFLNMRHINQFGKSVDFPMLDKFIQENKVMKFLKINGYNVVNISSNIGKIQNLKYATWNVKCGSFLADEFESMLIRMTIFDVFKEQLNLAYFYREKILTALSKIGEVNQEVQQPFFLFAHIMPPHPPYVFGRRSQALNSSLDLTNWGEMWEQKNRYIDQVVFINGEIKKIMSKILAESKTEPVIIIHGDHGPQLTRNSDEETLKARMRIFYAYYIPKGEKDFLGNSKTLVNIFPNIFNNYFETHFDLQEENSYFTDYSIPYKFTDVTSIVDLK